MAERNPQDRLLQVLSAMLIEMNALEAVTNEGDTIDAHVIRGGLKSLAQMTQEAIYIVRSASDDQSPPELEGVTLAEALSRTVEETAETLGLSSRVSFSGVDEQGRPKEHELSGAAGRVLYLIAREALVQIQQHSGARRLRFMLSYGQDDVQMSIEDDGTLATVVEEVPVPAFAGSGSQFLVPAQPQVDGDARAEGGGTERDALRPYVDLRYRIELLGGTLEIKQSESGTRVLARLPYVPHIHEIATPAPQSAPLAIIPQTASQTVSVLIVDNQSVSRAGLRRLLESYPDLQVVGEAADGVQAVSETMELGPQVVLLDSQLPNGQSLEALRQIKQLNLNTHLLLLSTQDREEYLYETLRAGADGYVLKDIAPDELAQALRIVARGETVVQPQLAGRLLSRFGKQGRNGAPYEALTARELEVLRLLARGLRNKEIAARLYVSERTVNFHLANIYQKLNVSGRTEALSKAIEQGLVTANLG